MKRIVFVLIVSLLVPAAAWAQFETATVVGTVRDSSGGVVPSAQSHAHQYADRRLARANERRQRQLRVLYRPHRKLRGYG